MRNIGGQEVNYDSFKMEFDSNPALQGLIDNFNAQGVTLKTKKKELDQISNKKADGAGISNSAKRAAEKIINR